MITSCGSKQTSVKIVDSFCEGKYYHQKLVKQDFVNFAEIRANKTHRITVDKLTQQLTVNEKEFGKCKIE
jgi:hypothetical protein